MLEDKRWKSIAVPWATW